MDDPLNNYQESSGSPLYGQANVEKVHSFLCSNALFGKYLRHTLLNEWLSSFGMFT